MVAGFTLKIDRLLPSYMFLDPHPCCISLQVHEDLLMCVQMMMMMIPSWTP